MKITTLCLSTLIYLSSTAQWQYEGPSNFSAGQASYIDLVIDNNIPYVAYRDAANSNKITVKEFDGTNWTDVGTAGFTPSGAQDISMAFYNGYPHLAFIDAATGNYATVMAFDGSNWQNIGSPGFSPGLVSDVKIAFDGSVPYVAFVDWNASGKTTVMRYMTGTWQILGMAGFTADVANDLSFTMIGSTPYVSYQDVNASNAVSVMYFDGANWVYAGSQGFSSGVGDRTTLTNDGSNVYIGYRDQSLSQKITVQMFNGSTWSIVGSAGFSVAGSDYLDIECLSGVPHIGYRDDGNAFKATVKKFDGSSWVDVGNPGFTPSQAIYCAIGFNDTVPMIAYQDFDGGNYTISVEKYIPCIDPDDPVVTVNYDTICQGTSFILDVTGGNLNSATDWHVYQGGCTGTSVASGPTGPFEIYPSGSATYYIRGEGGCVGFIPCMTSQVVTVLSVDTNITWFAGELSVGNGDETAYQWLDCNNAFAPWIGDTNQIFIPPGNGSYAVEVTENGCIDTSGCIIISNVGSDQYYSESIRIFPNPATEQVNITVPETHATGIIQIKNMKGQLIDQIQLNGSTQPLLNVSNFSKGIYLIEIWSDENVLRSKLLIE